MLRTSLFLIGFTFAGADIFGATQRTIVENRLSQPIFVSTVGVSAHSSRDRNAIVMNGNLYFQLNGFYEVLPQDSLTLDSDADLALFTHVSTISNEKLCNWHPSEQWADFFGYFEISAGPCDQFGCTGKQVTKDNFEYRFAEFGQITNQFRAVLPFKDHPWQTRERLKFWNTSQSSPFSESASVGTVQVTPSGFACL